MSGASDRAEMTIEFCEPGDWYSVPWVGGGFSRCFLELVGSITTAGVFYLLGMTAFVLAPKAKKDQKAVKGN